MLQRARKAGTAQLAPVSAVTKGLQGRELVDFDGMIQAGVRMFSDDGLPIDDQALLLRAFDDIAATVEDSELQARLLRRAGRVVASCMARLPEDDFARLQGRLATMEARLVA